MTDPSDDRERRTLTIDESQAGERLDRALAALWPDLSRSRLKQLIESNTVTINGKAAANPAQKVRLGVEVALVLPALIDAVNDYATLGELMAAMGDVFGRHVEVPTI